MIRLSLLALFFIGDSSLALQLDLAPHGVKYGDSVFRSWPDGGEVLNLPVKIFLGTEGYTQAYVSIS